MTQRVEAPPEFAGTLFDVTVTLPEGKRVAEIDPVSLQAAGIPAQHLDHLIRLLRAGQTAKVKGAVPWKRATQIAERFGRTGVSVAISRSLSIRTIATDGLQTCPACDARVKLPANRQCPACKIFVDKVTPEFLEQRKLADSVRAVREAEEAEEANVEAAEKRRLETVVAEYQAGISRELGPRYQLVRKRGLLEGVRGKVRAVAVLGSLGAMFAGGYWVSANFVHGAKTETGAPESATVATINQLLERVGLKSPRSEPISGPLVMTPVESLFRGPDGRRVTLRGLTLERAVEGALSRHAPGQVVNASADKSAMPTISVPMQTKLLLAASFARGLAEMGQVARAQDVVRALKDAPELSTDNLAGPAVRLADLEAQAWSMQALPETRARQAGVLLKQALMAITDPVERVTVMSHVGAILSRHTQLPPEIAQTFLTLASESAKTIADAKHRANAMAEWSVAMGEAHAIESTTQAKAGMHSQARTAAGQLEALIKQAPDEWSRARLLAIDYRLRQQLGDTEKATASLDGALTRVAKIENLAERGATLRVIAQRAGPAATDRVQAALAAIEPQIESKTGVERARSWTQLALLKADQGATAQSDKYGQLAQATAGLSAADAVTVSAELIVQRDLANAKTLQAGGRYAEAEQVLQRLAGYLR